MSEILLPMFSSRIFMFLSLTFKSNTFLVYSCIWCKKGRLISFGRHRLLNRLSLPHCMVLPPLSNINWPFSSKVWVYFWTLYSVPLNSMSIFMPVPCRFDNYGLVVYSLISGSMIPPILFFFIKIAMTIQGIWLFHINFWNICSSSLKYTISILTGIALNL